MAENGELLIVVYEKSGELIDRSHEHAHRFHVRHFEDTLPYGGMS